MSGSRYTADPSSSPRTPSVSGVPMTLLLALLACTLVASPPPEPPPEEAMDAVLRDLQAASQRAFSDREGALEAWNVARVRFEDQVEPGLRATRDPLDVAAAEYTFSRIHAALSKGGDAAEEIALLGRRLRPPRVANR